MERARGLRWIGEGGLEDFDGRVARGHRGEGFFARVRLRAWREIAADEEGDLGFEAAVAPAVAGERAAGGGDPGERHGGEHGRGVGRGRADLPAADVAECSDHAVLDGVGFVERLRLEVRGKIGEGIAGAARVEQRVGGVDDAEFFGSGHGFSVRRLVSPMSAKARDHGQVQRAG